jgi:hypothetical protein
MYAVFFYIFARGYNNNSAVGASLTVYIFKKESLFSGLNPWHHGHKATILPLRQILAEYERKNSLCLKL